MVHKKRTRSCVAAAAFAWLCTSLPVADAGLCEMTGWCPTTPSAVTLTLAEWGPVTEVATRKFITTLLKKAGAGLTPALQHWRAQHKDISLIPLMGTHNESKQACAQLFKDTPTRQRVTCTAAYEMIILGMTANKDHASEDKRESAWVLFTEMLPRLHDAGMPLDFDMTKRKGGKKLSVGLTESAPATPLAVALLTGHTAAVEFLAAHRYCNAVYKNTSKGLRQATPHSLLIDFIYQWSYRLVEIEHDILFSSDHVAGKFKPFKRHLAMLRQQNAEKGTQGTDGWTQSGRLGLLYQPSRDMLRLLQLFYEGTKGPEWSADGRLHSMPSSVFFDEIDKLIALQVVPLLKCYTPGLLNWKQARFSWGGEELGVLHVASKRGLTRTIKLLLQAGADPDQPSVAGFTPTHLALVEGWHNASEVLMAASKREADMLVGLMLEKRQAGRVSDRMRTDAAYRRNVNSRYEKEASSRALSGGWSTEELQWPPQWVPPSLHSRSSACDFDELDAVSLDEQTLAQQFLALKNPVIIRGLASDFYARKLFKRSALRKAMGKLQVTQATIPYQAGYVGPEHDHTSDINELLTNMDQSLATAESILDAENGTAVDAPIYLFLGTDGAETLNKIHSLAKIPKAWWLPQGRAYSDTNEGVDEMQFYLGGAGTGAPFHYHDNAWNALMYGKKRWFVMPPGQAIFSVKPAVQFLKDHYATLAAGPHPPFECVQESGDVIIVPAGWSHLILNLQASVGVATEFGGVGITDGLHLFTGDLSAFRE